MFGLFKNKTETRGVGTTSGGMVDLFNKGFLNNKREALNIATAYRCISIITATIADTRMAVVSKEGHDDPVEAPVLKSLLENPNPYQTYTQIMSNLVQDVVTQGNGYLWIDGKELWHIPADSIDMYMTTDVHNPLYYKVSYFGKSFDLFKDDVIHVRNTITTFPSSGYEGISPITAHRLTFDSALSTVDFMQDFYKNAPQLSGTLETPNRLQPQVVEDLRKAFKAKFTGAGRTGGVPVLTDDLKFKQLTPVSPLDADYIKSKTLNDEDIARIFGVPPALLGIGEAKFSNFQQQQKLFDTYTLSPLLTSIMQEFTKKLIPSYAQAQRKIIFEKDMFRYSSADEISQAVSLLTNSSVMTINEARKIYSLKSVSSGNELMVDKEAKKAEKAKADRPAQPKTPSEVTGESPNNANRSLEDAEKEIHKLKTQIGRLKHD